MAELTEQQKQAAWDAWCNTAAKPCEAVYAVYAAGLAEGAKPQPASADDVGTVHCMREAICDVDGHRPSRPAAESALAVARRGWVQAGTTIPLEALGPVTDEEWKEWWAQTGTMRDVFNSILAARRAKYAPAPKQDAAVEAVKDCLQNYGSLAENPAAHLSEAKRIVAAVRAADGGGK